MSKSEIEVNDQLILNFLKRWKEDPNQSSGLCYSFRLYLKGLGKSLMFIMEAEDYLSKMFFDSGLSECYPFGKPSDFYSECKYKTCHLNPKRIKWVNDKIAELEANIK